MSEFASQLVQAASSVASFSGRAVDAWMRRASILPNEESAANSPSFESSRNDAALEKISLKWLGIYAAVLFLFYTGSYPLIFRSKRLFYHSPNYQWVKVSIVLWLFFSTIVHVPSIAACINAEFAALLKTVLVFFIPTYVAGFLCVVAHHFLVWLVFEKCGLDKRLNTGRIKKPRLRWRKRTNVTLRLVLPAFVVSLACACVLVICASSFATAYSASVDICAWIPHSGFESFHFISLTPYLSVVKVAAEIVASPVGPLWMSLVALSATWVVFTSSAPKSSSANRGKRGEQPHDLLPMVQWYSILLFQTAWNVAVSIQLFLGRYDHRVTQSLFPSRGKSVPATPAEEERSKEQVGERSSSNASKGKTNDDEQRLIKELGVDDRFADRSTFSFSWMADTGDGGQSTYACARALAQPQLSFKSSVPEKEKILKRSELLLIGGDLCYPSPTIETYDSRLFVPFEYAMEPPPSFSRQDISFPRQDGGQKNKGKEQEPICYAIPGNHDWFDGLAAFSRTICARDYLGGWRLPQDRSFFCLKLPQGWWLFGLDLALENDIDMRQYQYFVAIAESLIKDTDRVIFCTHEPTWLLDAYDGVETSSPNVKSLMRTKCLRGKVAMRIAGDVHNYMRHSPRSMRSSQEVSASHDAGAAEVLVVSGNGGAFLHPTHNWPRLFKETSSVYKQRAVYPSEAKSLAVCVRNILGFRSLNWRFDVLGVAFYFALLFSFFPRCNLRHIVHAESLWPNGISLFFAEIATMHVEMLSESWATPSLIVYIVTLGILTSFADAHIGFGRRLLIGILHTTFHTICAFALFLLLNITVSVALEDGVLSSVDKNALYETARRTPVTISNAMWEAAVQPLLKFCLRLFDIPQAMGYSYATLCCNVPEADIGTFELLGQNGTSMPCSSGSLSRLEFVHYYSANFMYLFVIGADIISIIFGCYLYISCAGFNLMWNEAFSSLRFPHFKGYMHFQIEKNGNLHAHSIGIDKVPHDWKRDKKWMSTQARMISKRRKDGSRYQELDPDVASYGASRPSKWIPAVESEEELALSEPRIVDEFIIHKTPLRHHHARMRHRNTHDIRGRRGGNGSERRLRSGSDDFVARSNDGMFSRFQDFCKGFLDNSVNNRRVSSISFDATAARRSKSAKRARRKRHGRSKSNVS